MKNKISPRPDVEDARNEKKKRIASRRGRDSPEVGFIFADVVVVKCSFLPGAGNIGLLLVKTLPLLQRTILIIYDLMKTRLFGLTILLPNMAGSLCS